MSNPIQAVNITQERVDSVQAELRVTVELAHSMEQAELRGQFVGPRCPGMQLVDVAYLVKMISREDCTLVGRVIIAEPHFWTETQPFTYEGMIEVWENGKRVDSRTITTKFARSGK